MASPAQVRATSKYIKEHTRRYVIQCNNDKDSDIIEFLAKQPNVNGFIKGLIRERIREKVQESA